MPSPQPLQCRESRITETSGDEENRWQLILVRKFRVTRQAWQA